MTPHHRMVSRLLKATASGGTVKANRWEVIDCIPYWWRDEAMTLEGWFTGFCRAFGLHVSRDIERGDFLVRRTTDVADEATIRVE